MTLFAKVFQKPLPFPVINLHLMLVQQDVSPQVLLQHHDRQPAPVLLITMNSLSENVNLKITIFFCNIVFT